MPRIAKMKRQPVDSSAAASIGYDSATGTLEVEYKSGGVYRYYNVPESIYQQLMSAESIGAFLNVHIKPTYSRSDVDKK